jgi:hypothetical protein
MEKLLLCRRRFNEQGLVVEPGVAAYDARVADYLLSNYPAYFTVAPDAAPEAAPLASPPPADGGRLADPPADAGAATGIDAPPADKMVKRSRRKAV